MRFAAFASTVSALAAPVHTITNAQPHKAYGYYWVTYQLNGQTIALPAEKTIARALAAFRADAARLAASLIPAHAPASELAA